VVLVLLAPAVGSYAQEQDGKKAMQIEDYGRWRSITSAGISDDGQWAHFAYRTPDADDTLFVRSLAGETEYMIPRGQRPQFSDDARWVAYVVATAYEEAEKLREDSKPVPQSAQLMNLETGEKVAWENVDSFTFSKGSGFLAVKKRKLDREAEHDGTDLILRNLKEGVQELLGSVGAFAFNKPGSMMAYTVAAADRTGNGLYLINLETGARRPLDNGNLDYAQMTWDEEGRAVAVLKGEKKEGNVQKDNVLIAVTRLDRRQPEKSIFDPAGSDGFPEGFVVSERGSLTWSEDLATVFMGIKEQEKEPEKGEKGAKKEKVANVDIWHWQDDRLQSVQMLQANRDRNFTYRSAVHIRDGRFVQLTDKTMKNLTLTKNGRWGVGTDDRAYISDWKESRGDYYRVDTRSGERTMMFKAQGRTLGLSPDSKNFLYWKDGNIWLYVLSSGRTVNLTGGAPVSFVNTEFDNPGTPPPYGVVGWSKDGKSVILNHRYDLWQQPLDGRPASNLTNGVGSSEEIRFRYIPLERENGQPQQRFRGGGGGSQTIDLSKPMLLSAYGQWTKTAGFYRLENGQMNRLVYEDKSYGNPTRAKNADRFLYTIETFRDFADYHVSGPDFASPRQVTDAIPWQEEYRWGDTMLIDYTNKDGVRLQAVLAIPDGYQTGQKLPMLVDFYEKNSQNLNRYPRAIYRDTPMFSKYVSNGYLVLLPDVHFRTRTTHSDHLECIEAAIQTVVELGYVDPDRIGIHGHSFSGQGSAYIATHSDLFAAICYGAGATNLVSDFNQLWKSSGTNQHRYDTYGQGRFGTNIFDDLELYIEQSAVYHARNVTSPLLVMHGIDDGSVEWLQAVEFYNALRYNGKSIILCAYPGEGHHLAKRENQIDFQTRMEEFFDHYLKGEPAPDWMINGVPFLKKPKN
jgi:dipeptidyl aminopeptidase/acylaminoacyl peptidase